MPAIGCIKRVSESAGVSNRARTRSNVATQGQAPSGAERQGSAALLQVFR